MTTQMIRGVAVLLGAVVLLAGCSSAGSEEIIDPVAPTYAPDPTDGAVVTLAKVDGWRADFAVAVDSSFGVLEVAYDADSARALWDENVADDLPVRTGEPREPGVYGDVGSVDFDEQVVALFSSGQSGSCPTWVQGVETAADGTVALTTARDVGACTDD